MNTKIIKLDINKRLYDKIVAKQDDTKSRFLLFQLLDGAVPFNLTDRSVKVYGVKPDGAVIFNDLTVTHSITGFCLLELTNQMLAIAGTVKLELMITEGDKKLTSIPFDMEVIKKINSNTAIESSNEFRSLLNALKEIDDWNKEFADKSSKLEELYTPRLNELESQLEDNALNSIETDISLTKLNNVLDGNLIIDKVQGKTKYKKTDGTIVDVWESGVTLISVGEDNANKLEISTCAKNLFDLNKFLFRTQSATYVIKDNTITITSDKSTSASMVVFKLKVLPNTQYTFSCKSTRTGSNGGGVYISDTGDHVLADKSNLLNPVVTFTTLSYSTIYINLYAESGSKTGSSATYSEIQLELDNKTAYEPYKQDKQDKSEISLVSPLREWDYVDEKGVHRKSQQVVFDGSADEVWKIYRVCSEGFINFMVYLEVKAVSSGDRTRAKCDKLQHSAWMENPNAKRFYISASTGDIVEVTLPISELLGYSDTLSEAEKINLFKVWLNANPLTIAYETADETIETLNETLILSSFKDGYFGISAGAINPVVSLSFPTNIGERVTGVEESTIYLRNRYYESLKVQLQLLAKDVELETNKLNASDLLNKVYPVGSVYISTANTNPNTFIGGTWVKFAEGQTLIGASSTDSDFFAGKTGGEKVHKLTEQEMPSHSHTQFFYNPSASGTPGVGWGFNYTSDSTHSVRSDASEGSSGIGNSGSGNSHNNMPPFIVVYMWKRTA